MNAGSRADVIRTLIDYFKADIKGVYIFTEEREVGRSLVKKTYLDMQADSVLFEYSLDAGLYSEEYRNIDIYRSNPANVENIRDISEAIGYVIKQVKNGWIKDGFPVIIFYDISSRLSNDELFASKFYSGIMEFIENGGYYYIISSQSIVPPIIEKRVFYLEVPLMDKVEIRRLLEDKLGQNKVEVSSEYTKEKVINALYGLTESEIGSLINLSINDKVLDDEDIKRINTLKKNIIKKSGLLEFVVSYENLDNIGGFVNLKKWVKRKKEIIDRIEEAKKFGVNIPKGILLFGMPGCGKSLSAKAIANIFGIPLLRLDMGLILGPYVGMSEENIRKALRQAESISPCVLWIDEIEKALAGVGGSGRSAEVTTRIFGSLLTWMQEKKQMVFVVATSNNISGLPAEFLRKGRFDEIFFVDFPDESSMKEIIEIHLKKRGKGEWIKKLPIDDMVKKTTNYSGADLESIVSDIIEEAFIKRSDEPDLSYIEKVLKSYIPLSESLKDELSEMRKKCEKYKFVNVDK